MNKLYQELLEKIQRFGHKLTPTRKLVLEILCKEHNHLTSREILAQAEKQNPEVSRASLFRTLDLFTRCAIVRPTYVENGTPSFVLLNPHGHHAHIICPGCQKVEELEGPYIDGLAQQMIDQLDRNVSGQLVEFYGFCEDCQEKK